MKRDIKQLVENNTLPDDPTIRDWVDKNTERLCETYGQDEGTLIAYTTAWNMDDIGALDEEELYRDLTVHMDVFDRAITELAEDVNFIGTYENSELDIDDLDDEEFELFIGLYGDLLNLFNNGRLDFPDDEDFDDEFTDDMADMYAESYMDEHGEVFGAIILEALTREQRRARSMRMRRNRFRIAKARERAARRRANSKVLGRRARRAAVKALKSRFSRGRNVNELSTAEKAQLEKRVKRAGKIVDRLSTRLLRDVRKRDQEKRSGGQQK